MTYSYLKPASLALCVAFFGVHSFAQTAPASKYPYVSPTAASGQTSGSGVGRRTSVESLHMLQGQAESRDSDRLAAAAAIANQHNQAIEDQQLNAALQKARQRKELKRQAAERVKWERATAANAFQKVSQGEVTSWREPDGSIKLGRDVPAEFLEVIRKQEAAAVAEAQQKKSFSPIKNIGKRVSETIEEQPVEIGLVGGKPLPPEEPGVRSTFVTDPLAQQERPKVLKFKAPKFNFPKLGNGRNNAAPDPVEQQPRPAVQSQQPRRVAQQNVPAFSTAKPPAAIGQPVAKPKPVSISSNRSAADLIKADTQTKKKSGLFSRNKQPIRKPAPSATAAPSFSFNKKADETEVDAGLFPTTGQSSAVSVRPQIPQLKKKAFSIPKSQPKPRKSITRGSAGVPEGTTVNRNGNSFYVVNANSQFLKHGADANSSTILAVSPGTVVQMKKPGADWALVTLKDGSRGVIQTKNLRAATGAGF